MAKQPKVRPVEEQCSGKFAYETKTRAKRALRRMRSRNRRIVAYRCPHCSGFHLGGETK